MDEIFNIAKRLETIEAPILTDRIFDSLKDRILSNYYHPGQRLNEMRIADALGTSRSPVREAFQRLASRGLIKLIPRKGAFVNTHDDLEIRELFELREALEVLAVRLSTIRAQQDQLDALRINLERTEAILKSSQVTTHPHSQFSIYPWNIDFHKQIFQMTFNPKLETMGLELCSKLQLVRSHSGSQGERAIEALREHEEIFRALRSRDPDRAEEKARHHMRNALKNLTQMTPVLKH